MLLRGKLFFCIGLRYEDEPLSATPGNDLLAIRLLKEKDNTARWKAAHFCRKTAAPIASDANSKSDAENPRRRSIVHNFRPTSGLCVLCCYLVEKPSVISGRRHRRLHLHLDDPCLDQVFDNLRHDLLGALHIGLYHQLRIRRLFIGRRNAGELRNLAAQRLGVESLGIAPLADFQVALDDRPRRSGPPAAASGRSPDRPGRAR